MTTIDFFAAQSQWRDGDPDPLDQLVGRRAVFTTYEGERRVGVVGSELRSGLPFVEFGDGTWGRLDPIIELSQ